MHAHSRQQMEKREKFRWLIVLAASGAALAEPTLEGAARRGGCALLGEHRRYQAQSQRPTLDPALGNPTSVL